MTASPEITPDKDPVMVAAVVPSYDLLTAAGDDIVKAKGVISPVIPVGADQV